MRLAALISLTAAAVLGAMPGLADAQGASTFPTRVVTLVAPYTANSGSDIIARIVAPRLSARWGQPVIVDNKPGASGNIGTNYVAKAAPDGYTLLMMINSITMTPSLYKSTPYDLVADFAPIAKLAEAGFALAVNPAVPVTDMDSLIAYVKQNPGKASYASPGTGTTQHLAMALLQSRYELDMLHVPYKGISGALTDLLGGQVQMMFGSVHSMLPNVQAGKLRLVAVGGDGRNPLAPTVKTFREQGVDVMDGIDAWYAVMAPARTPPELVARLNRDFLAVLDMEDVKAELNKVGLSVQTSTPQALGSLVKNDLARWSKIIKAAGITAE
jgi:tripartite-type tricarboxylate transporter receptor subunit TctC